MMAKIKIKYKEAKEYEKKGIIRITEEYRHTKHKDDDIVEAVTVEEDEKNIKKHHNYVSTVRMKRNAILLTD